MKMSSSRLTRVLRFHIVVDRIEERKTISREGFCFSLDVNPKMRKNKVKRRKSGNGFSIRSYTMVEIRFLMYNGTAHWSAANCPNTH